MKTASTALKTYVPANRQLQIADLYTITPTDGSAVLRWCSGDTDLVVGATTWSRSGPRIKRGGVRQSVGAEVATVDVALHCGGGFLLPDGRRLTLAAAGGFLDGAAVQIDRLIMATWGTTTMGVFNVFAGSVADVVPSSTVVKLALKSGMEYLRALQMPRRLFQPHCPHDLYGAACGVTKSPTSSTVAAGSTTTTVNTSGIQATGYWDLGTIRFTSGALAGLNRQILTSTCTGGQQVLTLAVPLPSAPAAGITASLLRGCDKSWTACGSKFSNQQRFGGYPWVPKPESIR